MRSVQRGVGGLQGGQADLPIGECRGCSRLFGEELFDLSGQSGEGQSVLIDLNRQGVHVAQSSKLLVVDPDDRGNIDRFEDLQSEAIGVDGCVELGAQGVELCVHGIVFGDNERFQLSGVLAGLSTLGCTGCGQENGWE